MLTRRNILENATAFPVFAGFGVAKPRSQRARGRVGPPAAGLHPDVWDAILCRVDAELDGFEVELVAHRAPCGKFDFNLSTGPGSWSLISAPATKDGCGPETAYLFCDPALAACVHQLNVLKPVCSSSIAGMLLTHFEGAKGQCVLLEAMTDGWQPSQALVLNAQNHL